MIRALVFYFLYVACVTAVAVGVYVEVTVIEPAAKRVLVQR